MHGQSAGAVGLPGLVPLQPSMLLFRPRGQQEEQSTSRHHVTDDDQDRRDWPSGRCEVVKKEGSKGLGGTAMEDLCQGSAWASPRSDTRPARSHHRSSRPATYSGRGTPAPAAESRISELRHDPRRAGSFSAAGSTVLCVAERRAAPLASPGGCPCHQH